MGRSGGGRTLSVVDLLGGKEGDQLGGGEPLQGSVLLPGAAPADETWSMATLLLLGLVEFLCGAALSILAPFYTSEATDHGLSGEFRTKYQEGFALNQKTFKKFSTSQYFF